MLVAAIALATVTGFVISFIYYAAAPSGPPAQRPPGRPQAWQIAVELLRSAIVAGLMAGLLLAAEWGGPAQGALLGLALWALPVVLLAGSVVWEDVPLRSAALHAGDWLLKLVAIGAVVGLCA